MSASLRKRPDYCVTANGRDVPQAAVSNRSKAALIRSPSAEQQAGRNFMADRFCKLQIDDQLALGWLVAGRSAGFARRSQNQTHAPYR
jgi:hypothetical protein